MLRSFPTCLPNFLTGVVLLVPCLLICLACVTPFPIEALEEGMTTEAVRENFGEPEAVETKTGDAESSWTYLHEGMDPVPLLVGPMPLRVAVASITWGVLLSWLFALMDVVSDDLTTGLSWNFAYVSRAPVVLEFEEEKLVRWAVLGDIRESCGVGGSGCPSSFRDPFPIPGSGSR